MKINSISFLFLLIPCFGFGQQTLSPEQILATKIGKKTFSVQANAAADSVSLANAVQFFLDLGIYPERYVFGTHKGFFTTKPFYNERNKLKQNIIAAKDMESKGVKFGQIGYTFRTKERFAGIFTSHLNFIISNRYDNGFEFTVYKPKNRLKKNYWKQLQQFTHLKKETLIQDFVQNYLKDNRQKFDAAEFLQIASPNAQQQKLITVAQKLFTKQLRIQPFKGYFIMTKENEISSKLHLIIQGYDKGAGLLKIAKGAIRGQIGREVRHLTKKMKTEGYGQK